MYKQPREAHEARIYTQAYRVYGLIHLVPGSGTADLLNQERPYLPVTGALLYTPGYRHPPEAKELKASTGFLALRKERIQWAVGGRPAEPRTSPTLLERRRLAFLFGEYLVAGELLLPRGVRLSDHLSQAKPFQTLLEARLYTLSPDKPIVELSPVESFPFVTVNLRQAEAVAEAPGEAHDPRLTLFG
ncbi:MAG: hypothetical protein NZ846_03930 [Thermus sp.]|uniref:DUF6812 domain-containing protein n=1 Tax=Thermus sp. TaxID=275 RepID=UPI0025ECB566|nr:hypothetical protein [Thermus sp.]MCS6867874.1 hypothetical protein [Thermus sp.]MCS7218112.1 hypothetical protein [Thermus sp.]MDW8017760.1 hypothetical protein [Thermus sp.]MDW8357680.1 hypothetical protein [Thermus sp.]